MNMADLGAVGPTGPMGPTGAPGTLSDTLPSGATLTGAFGMRGDAAAINEAVEDSISFQMPLTSSPTIHLIADGDTPPAECPGTALAPAAMAGHLCVYFGFESANVSTRGFYSAADGAGTILTHGAVVFIRAAASGYYEAAGVWAVTAP